ncbi:unnamed protein product, partial [Effrenium voratum]
MAPLHDATSFAETPAMLISGTPSRKDCKLERATFAFDGGWGKEGCCNMHLAGCRSSASWRVLKVDLDWRGAAVRRGDGREIWRFGRRIRAANGLCLAKGAPGLAPCGPWQEQEWQLLGTNQLKLSGSGVCLSVSTEKDLDVALGQSAHSSSDPCDPMHTADRAVDGNPSSYWASEAPVGGQVDWELSFPRARLKSADIDWEFPPSGFSLQVTKDGDHWREVYSVASNPLHSSKSQIPLEGVEAVGARLRMDADQVVGIRNFRLRSGHLPTLEPCQDRIARGKWFLIGVVEFDPSKRLRSEEGAWRKPLTLWRQQHRRTVEGFLCAAAFVQDSGREWCYLDPGQCDGNWGYCTPVVDYDAQRLAIGLDYFCQWWLRPHKGQDKLHEEIFAALEEGLFPEGQTSTAAAPAFRSMAELAVRLCQNATEKAKADQLLVGFFKHFKEGWAYLFVCLASKHLPAHPAAAYAHSRLVELVGGLKPEKPAPQSKKAKKRKKAGADRPHEPLQCLELCDGTRLSILVSLQEHQAFQRVPGNLKRQWQQALLSPLSPPGVRSRCGTLINYISQGTGPPSRVVAAQLEQLAVHSKVPDEVVLAVVFQQFLASFIKAPAGATFSLRNFKAAVGLPKMPAELEDVALPSIRTDKEERLFWRAKLWSTVAQLARRTWPEAAERLITGEAEASAVEAFSGGEEGPGSMVRSLAFQGCLADGTLLVLRLHQWWNHVLTTPPAVATPSKKKTDAGCQCLVKLEDTEESLRRRALQLCQLVMELDGRISDRQKNAICSLPLSLSLVLLDENLPGRDSAREMLSELMEIIDSLVNTAKASKSKKKMAEQLANVAPVAAESYVADSPPLVREASKMAWRELGYYAADETLRSLCSSVCGAPDADADAEAPEDEEEDADEDDEDEGGARKAAFDSAIAEMKAKNEAKASAKAEEEEEEEEEDVTTLDHSGVLSQLLGDGGGELLNSFAASSLDGATGEKKKLTKRQQKLKRQQDEFIRRLREADLVESFLIRSGSKREISLNLVEELYPALVVLKHKARFRKEDKDEKAEEQGKGKKKRQTKADSTLKALEDNLCQRVHKMLVRLMRTICRPGAIQILAGWQPDEEWASKARALSVHGLTPKVCASGPQVLEVGSSFFYFLCAAHRAASQEEGAEQSPSEGWTLAEELLTQLLQEWAGKKECDQWCQAALKAFAARLPMVLLRLPWIETVKGARKAFAQRNQLAFLGNTLLRPLPPEVSKADVAKQLEFADSCAFLCAELLESTIDLVEEAQAASSTSQKHKLRREALQTLKAIHRLRRQKSNGFPAAVSAAVAKAIAGLRDSLPNQQRRGEVYQLCVHLL